MISGLKADESDKIMGRPLLHLLHERITDGLTGQQTEYPISRGILGVGVNTI